MNFDFQQIFGIFICFVGALSIHEWAHAFAAVKLGDSTPRTMGRLTLDPLAHIDPLGTIVLPLIGMITHFPLIGWAKPVIVNPRNFKGDIQRSSMLVSAAGPIANLILCFVSLLMLALINVFFWQSLDKESLFYPLLSLLKDFAFINSILAFFNLIPLPPLDGGGVVAGLLPRDLAEKYERSIAPYGTWILLLLLWTGGLFWVNKLALFWVNLQISSIYNILKLVV